MSTNRLNGDEDSFVSHLMWQRRALMKNQIGEALFGLYAKRISIISKVRSYFIVYETLSIDTVEDKIVSPSYKNAILIL